MTTLEIMFALGRQIPFNGLSVAELEIAASITHERHFDAGALVLGDSEPFRRLLILLDGSWHCNDETLPTLLGVGSLLAGTRGPGEVRAGAAGAHCLVITRGHFFTLVNECPALLLILLSMADKTGDERVFV